MFAPQIVPIWRLTTLLLSKWWQRIRSLINASSISAFYCSLPGSVLQFWGGSSCDALNLQITFICAGLSGWHLWAWICLPSESCYDPWCNCSTGSKDSNNNHICFNWVHVLQKKWFSKLYKGSSSNFLCFLPVSFDRIYANLSLTGNNHCLILKAFFNRVPALCQAQNIEPWLAWWNIDIWDGGRKQVDSDHV